MTKQEIRTVLWDVAPRDIDSLPADFIIRRALSYGGLFLIGKMMHTYGRERVKKEFEAMKPTSISKRKYFYLKNFLLA